MKYAKLSAHKIKKIMICFSEDLSFSKTAILLNINRKTVDHYNSAFRKIIYFHVSLRHLYYKLSGEVEVCLLNEPKKNSILLLKERGGPIKIEFFHTNGEIPEIIQRNICFGAFVYTKRNLVDHNLSMLGYKHCELGNKETEILFKRKVSLNEVISFLSFLKKRRAAHRSCLNNQSHFMYESVFRFNHRDSILKELEISIKNQNIL